jgi:hypothetical protein
MADLRVTVVDKNKAFVCCLLATSAIKLSEKKKRERKMWSKKWYLKRNIDLMIILSGMAFYAADTHGASSEGAARKGRLKESAD